MDMHLFVLVNHWWFYIAHRVWWLACLSALALLQTADLSSCPGIGPLESAFKQTGLTTDCRFKHMSTLFDHMSVWTK